MVHGISTDREVVKVSGKSKEILTVRDKSGKILHKVISPLMVEFHEKDVLQVIVGASLLAIPLAFTEESWELGLRLPGFNIFLIFLMSIVFIASFVYYNYYKGDLRQHINHFIKRVALTYILSFVVVGLVLSLIQLAPWTTDTILAVKRTILVAFPASMSAAVADFLK